MALFGSVILILSVTLAVVGVVALLVALVVRPGPWIVRTIEVACWVVMAAAAITGAIAIGQSLIGDLTTVEVPIAVHAPDVKVPGVELVRPSAVIVSGGVDRATLTIRGLSGPTRVLLSLATLLQMVTTVFLASIIRRLARNVRIGAPFTNLARPLVQAGGVLLAGSFFWSIAGSIGSFMAGREALEIHGWSMPDTAVAGFTVDTATALSYLGWPEPAGWSVTFSSLPFAAALVLVLLGLVFRTGERMQADTEGLI